MSWLFGSGETINARTVKDSSDPAQVVKVVIDRVEHCHATKDRVDSLTTLKSLVKDYPELIGEHGYKVIGDLLSKELENAPILELVWRFSAECLLVRRM